MMLWPESMRPHLGQGLHTFDLEGRIRNWSAVIQRPIETLVCNTTLRSTVRSRWPVDTIHQTGEPWKGALVWALRGAPRGGRHGWVGVLRGTRCGFSFAWGAPQRFYSAAS